MWRRARILLLPCSVWAAGCFAEPPVPLGGNGTDAEPSPNSETSSEDSGSTTTGDPSATSLGSSSALPTGGPSAATLTTTSPGTSGSGTSIGTDDSGSSESGEGETGSDEGSTSGSTESDETTDASSSSGRTTDGTTTGGTTTSGTTTSTTSTTTGDPPDQCGNGMLDGDEHCDDGPSNGTEFGDCAPDCSAFIHEATIMVTDANLQASFAFGDSAIAVVDSACETEFGVGAQGLFSVGTERRATVTPVLGDGAIDWVLEPWTRYSNANGDLVWVTNAVPLLGVEDGGQHDLLAPIWIDPDNNPAFTGMNTNWTTMTDNDCNGWTSSTGQMSSGNPWFVEPDFLRLPGNSTCNNSRGLYCVLP